MCARQLSFNFSSMVWEAWPRAPPPLDPPLRRGTARRDMLVNSSCVLRAMGVIKVSNSKSDLTVIQGVIRQATYDFLLVFHCNYVSILHHFQDITTYFLTFKEVT